VLALARDLGLKTTAEGIETEAQRDWLRENGCDEGQGYLFGRPGTGAQARERIYRESDRMLAKMANLSR